MKVTYYLNQNQNLILEKKYNYKKREAEQKVTVQILGGTESLK